MPVAIALLSDARLAGIEQVEGSVHCVPHGTPGLEVDLVAGLPGLFDGGLKIGHGCPSGAMRPAFAEMTGPVKPGF